MCLSANQLGMRLHQVAEQEEQAQVADERERHDHEPQRHADSLSASADAKLLRDERGATTLAEVAPGSLRLALRKLVGGR